MTFEESVLEAADEHGDLSLKAAQSLFKQHGQNFWHAHDEGLEITLNAQKLLNWLGY